METKNVKVLGLDLGTNSIGHALVVKHYEGDAALPKSIEILDANSRIVPPRSAAKDPLADYLKGQKQQSTASERRTFRMTRRLNARFILRRERLFRVLHALGWLPAHMENALDWGKHLGRFKIQNDKSQKLSPTDATVEAPRMNWNGEKFAFPQAFEEMCADFNVPAGTLISHDWLIYFLRNKALSAALTNEELAYVIASFNAKRGYYQRGRNEDEDSTKIVRAIEPKIVEIRDICDADDLPKGTKAKDKNTAIVLDQKSQLRDEYGNAKTLCFFIDKFKDCAFANLKVGDKIANVVVEETIAEDDDGNEILAGTPKCTIDAWLFKKTRAAGTLENSGKTLGSAIYELLKESVKSGDVRIVGGIFGTVNRSFYVAELRKILEKQAEFHPELRSREALEKVALALYPKNENHRKQRTGMRKTLIDFLIDDVIFYQRPLKTKKSLIDKCELENRPCAAISNPFAQEFRVLYFLMNLRIRDARSREDCTQLFLPTPAHYQLAFDWLKARKEVDLTKDSFRKKLIEIAKTKIGGNVDFRQENIAATAKAIFTNFDEAKKVKLNATRERFSKHFRRLDKTFSYNLPTGTEYALWHICYSVTDPQELEKALRKFAGTHAEIFAGTRILPDDFCALNLHLARTLVYGNENAENQVKWRGGNDIREFISNARGNGFRAGSLRNPIVEAIALESLRVVADLVDKFGVPDEIHIELGRELNATAEKRKKISDENKKNEIARKNAENECRKLIQKYNSREKLVKLVERYLLWEEQGRRDPYVQDRMIGEAEMLNGEAYQIDHIIPYSKYNNDSRDNKVLTATSANKLKTDRTGMQFIEDMAGSTVDGIKYYTVDGYKENVTKFFQKNRKKQELLLKKDVPEGFYSAQLNNTRYITKFVATHLSKLVRGNVDDGNAISKNVLIVSGAISSRLKDDWGLGNAATGTWNLLMRERVRGIFGNAERQDDGTFSNGVDEAGKCHVPADATDKTGKGGLKRIDHRHHALDAIVIAACERRHVQAINTESAKDLMKKGEQKREFAPPVADFAKIAREALENKVVSIKGNNRVFGGNVSYVQTIQGKKRSREHIKQSGFVVRRRLHEDTFAALGKDGKPVLRVIFSGKKAEDIEKALSNCIDDNVKFIMKKWLAHKGDVEDAFSPNGLEEMNREIAVRGNVFTKRGNPHKPIKHLLTKDTINCSMQVSKSIFKPTKFARSAKGSNLMCAVYLDGEKWVRTTITTRSAMSEIACGNGQLFPKILIKGKKVLPLAFVLKPDDLVYVPANPVDEISIEKILKDSAHIFTIKEIKSSGGILGVPVNIASILDEKKEGKVVLAMSPKTFFPLQVDRLGNITGIVVPANKNSVPANGVPVNNLPKNS